MKKIRCALYDRVSTDIQVRDGLSLDAQREAAARLAVLLDTEPYPSAGTLRELDRAFTARNLSPGGSADLLALCWMLHFLREEED